MHLRKFDLSAYWWGCDQAYVRMYVSCSHMDADNITCMHVYIVFSSECRISLAVDDELRIHAWRVFIRVCMYVFMLVSFWRMLWECIHVCVYIYTHVVYPFAHAHLQMIICRRFLIVHVCIVQTTWNFRFSSLQGVHVCSRYIFGSVSNPGNCSSFHAWNERRLNGLNMLHSSMGRPWLWSPSRPRSSEPSYHASPPPKRYALPNSKIHHVSRQTKSPIRIHPKLDTW